MKQIKKIIMLITAVFISNILFGQSVSEMGLSGKWTASCPIEILNQATLKVCEICPTDGNPKNNALNIKDIKMTFKADTILIKQNETTTSVPYTKNKDTHAISFKLDSKQFNFRMFLDGRRRILVDTEGMIIVLKK